MSKSAIDLVLGSHCIIPYIESFKIEPFDRCLSDTHSGISLTLKMNCSEKRENSYIQPVDANCITFDLDWDED